jgi:hypothetical protein
MSVRSLRVMMGKQVSRSRLLELFDATDESALATGYPRFRLGPGQRVGSRDGRLMRFDPQRPALTAANQRLDRPRLGQVGRCKAISS